MSTWPTATRTECHSRRWPRRQHPGIMGRHREGGSSMRIATLLFAALLSMFAGRDALAYTAEELVAKNLAAKGGLENLRAIHSLRLEGKMLVNGDTLELKVVTLVKHPDAIRYEAEIQGLTQIQACDAGQAWQINPFQGRKDPEKLSADDAKGMGEDAADFLGPL